METTAIDNSDETTQDKSNAYSSDNTNDKIFLLSYQETSTYFESDEERLAKGTDYAKSQVL